MPRINHNVPAMITTSSLNKADRSISKSLEKLSTGLRINRAADDAAGLSVSEQLRTQVRGLNMGNRNIQDGMSLLNIAEGALIEMEDMSQRIRELAIQAANDTLTVTERTYIQVEVDELVIEIDRVSRSSQFNGMTLLDGSAPWGAAPGGIIQAGPNDTANDVINVVIGNISAFGLGLGSVPIPPAVTIPSVSVTSQVNATTTIGTMDAALNMINTLRADLGAKTNRLEHALNNQDNQEQNMAAAESVIRDTDFATETSKFTKDQILQQSSTAMLAQANQLPQSVLKLLG